jgi:hypothetical protein
VTNADIVTIVGLSLGTVGAILLAYDVVYGPGKRERAANLSRQLELLQRTRQFSRSTIVGLPKQYSEEDKNRLLAEEESQWGPKETTLKDANENFLRRYELRVIALGANGVLLILLAFVLQLVGVIMTSLSGH